MKNLCRKSMALLGLAMLANGAMPAARATEAESPLGSPADSSAFYTTNYAEAVAAALPRVDAGTLGRILADVERAAAEERPIGFSNLPELERFFGLRESGATSTPRGRFVTDGDVAYRFDPGQRFYFTQRYQDVPALPRAEGSRNLPAIRSAHADFVARLGIAGRGIHFTDFREVLSQTDGRSAASGGAEGAIESEGAVTTLLRAVAGVQVEGSYVRLASIDPSRLELADARWPVVRLSRQVATSGLRAPLDAADGIVAKVRADSGGLPVALHMAVVLRPLDEKGSEFVPSLKVGIEPKSIRTEEGFRTDAGEIFFVDLLRDSPPLAAMPEKREDAESDR